jgi:uncharacterized protein (DUF58 family)
MTRVDKLKFPIVVTGKRTALLKTRLQQLWNVILWAATIGAVLGWAAGETMLLYWIWIPLILLLSTLFGRTLPRLRLEAEAFYVEGDGGKVAHYWNDIGPVRLTAPPDGNIIWWRSIGAETARESKGRDVAQFSTEAHQVKAEVFFADPATEAAAFVATMNRCREALARVAAEKAVDKNVAVADRPGQPRESAKVLSAR